jgi:hypothetical protein
LTSKTWGDIGISTVVSLSERIAGEIPVIHWDEPAQTELASGLGKAARPHPQQLRRLV